MNEQDPNKQMNEEPTLVLDDATNKEIADFLADPSTGTVWTGRENRRLGLSPEEEVEGENFEADGNDEDSDLEDEDDFEDDDEEDEDDDDDEEETIVVN